MSSHRLLIAAVLAGAAGCGGNFSADIDTFIGTVPAEDVPETCWGDAGGRPFYTPDAIAVRWAVGAVLPLNVVFSRGCGSWSQPMCTGAFTTSVELEGDAWTLQRLSGRMPETESWHEAPLLLEAVRPGRGGVRARLNDSSELVALEVDAPRARLALPSPITDVEEQLLSEFRIVEGVAVKLMLRLVNDRGQGLCGRPAFSASASANLQVPQGVELNRPFAITGAAGSASLDTVVGGIPQPLGFEVVSPSRVNRVAAQPVGGRFSHLRAYDGTVEVLGATFLAEVLAPEVSYGENWRYFPAVQERSVPWLTGGAGEKFRVSVKGSSAPGVLVTF